MNRNNRRVLVGMSGGVDSSVCAYLLQREGYEPIGFSLKLWEHEQNQGITYGHCCSPEDFDDARQVAAQLGIPYYIVNQEQAFQECVVDYFIESYFGGETPNPCIFCNREVKFRALLEQAKALGAEMIATGHYARKAYDSHSRRWVLKKGIDPTKDQSYFLFAMTQKHLSSTMFPLGELRKDEVRRIAEEAGLVVSRKRDSQQLCFVGDQPCSRFIEREGGRAGRWGEIVDLEGNVLGSHLGIHRYTIGQRQGLGIAVGYPLYVIALDAERNRVVVGREQDLLRSTLEADNMHWISIPAPTSPVQARAKIRSQHREQRAVVRPLSGNRASVEFEEPQRAIAPGQAIVFYRGDTVLGGGWIRKDLDYQHLSGDCTNEAYGQDRLASGS